MSVQQTMITKFNEPEQGWIYHSAKSIYVERFKDGRLLASSLQDTGIPFHKHSEYKNTPAFNLQVDGESLYFGWEIINSVIEKNEKTSKCKITLRHTLKAVELNITTYACGDGFFRRQMKLRNTSKLSSCSLTSVTPLCGSIWTVENNFHIADTPLYRVACFADNKWGEEGNFQWQDIPLKAELSFGSQNGRSGHSMPFVVVHNNIYGGYFLAHLAWSANWKIGFFCERSENSDKWKLKFALQPVSPAPMRILSAGESIDIPEVHFGLNHDSFDDTIQCWHRYLRREILPKVGAGLQPLIYNHWGYMEDEMSEAKLMGEIDIAVELGAELFMVDAGWYADKNAEWQNTSGDWMTGSRLPNDLFPVFDYARSKGLKCGLWVEPESAGKLSVLARKHPDWFITRYNKPVERILDLTKPEVAKYIEDHIFRIIERYKLDMLRLDYNIEAHEGGFNERNGINENTLWRHVEVIYAIFDKVRQRYPNLQVENCAGGGGRTDLGMLSRFTTTWVSDWMRMPRTVKILNGMTIALPPEFVGRLLGVAINGSYFGNFETQLHVIMLGHPAVSGLMPSISESNPEVLELTKKYIKIYKEFIRPFIRESCVYHHSPVIPEADNSGGWCALEYVSDDKTKAVAGIFRLSATKDNTYVFRFRGLDPSRHYKIISEPGGLISNADGFLLLQDGLLIHLDTPLTSHLLLCEEVKIN